MIDRLVVATKNAGKAREFAQMLKGVVATVEHLAAYPDAPTAPENETTFAANALAKARHYQAWLRTRGAACCCLADDSGLEVVALGGRPGVYSARFAGPDSTDADNIALLLDELRATRDQERSARFVCALALVDEKGATMQQVRGVCEGKIARRVRGNGGFGYDPVFIPTGHSETFGEHPERKRELSHRARALQQLVHTLKSDVL